MLFFLGVGDVFAHPVTTKTAQIERAHEAVVVSAFTKETYRIQWMLIGDPPERGYPIYYLLDGDASFPVLSVVAQHLWQNKMSGVNVAALIVGIGYPDGGLIDIEKRARDYTPPLENSQASHLQGGADLFFQFIQYELEPFLKKKIPINEQERAIFGHSYGGLFALYCLFQYPDYFQYYLISSPSIWWEKKRVLDFHQKEAKNKAKGIRFSLGDQEIPNALSHSKKRERNMWGNLQALFTELEQRQFPATLHVYPDENHASVMYKALLDSLFFLQKSWQIK